MNPVVILIGLIVLVTGGGLTYSYGMEVNGVTTYPYILVGIGIALFGFLILVAGFAMKRGTEGHEDREEES